MAAAKGRQRSRRREVAALGGGACSVEAHGSLGTAREKWQRINLGAVVLQGEAAAHRGTQPSLQGEAVLAAEEAAHTGAASAAHRMHIYTYT